MTSRSVCSFHCLALSISNHWLTHELLSQVLAIGNITEEGLNISDYIGLVISNKNHVNLSLGCLLLFLSCLLYYDMAESTSRQDEANRVYGFSMLVLQGTTTTTIIFTFPIIKFYKSVLTHR